LLRWSTILVMLMYARVWHWATRTAWSIQSHR